MGDAGKGLERSIETIGYSPVAGTDRNTADLIVRSPSPSSDAPEGSHPDFAALVRHGAQMLEMGNDAEAAVWFRKALDFGDLTAGPEHPDQILVLNDLTRIYLRQGDHAAAEPLLLRLLDLKRSKGEDHPEVATVLAILAAVRQALGRHESAEQLWRRVLEIRERTLAPNHFAIATALEHLGEACAARGKIVEALAAFERAHTIRERTLGSDHTSLRISRERIADLQLQESDGSLEYSVGVGAAPVLDKYRLASGEPLAPAAPVPASPSRERTTAVSRKPAIPVFHEPPSSRPTTHNATQKDAAPPIIFVAPKDAGPPMIVTAPMDAGPPMIVAAPQADALPYQDALDSIREELEQAREGASLADRTNAILGAALVLLGKRQVVATVVVVVIALLGTAVATGARGWGEPDQTTARAAAAPTNQPATASAFVTSASVTTPDAVNPSVTAPANAASKSTPQRPRVTEERNTAKKVPDQKPDTRKIVIPGYQTAMMSRLDSVASSAANTSSLATENTFQPGPMPVGDRRTLFESGEQSAAPQRARLIGELPTPRIPSDVADVEGVVRVRFNVDSQGRPVMSTLVVETSPNPLLTSAVRSVIPGIRFEPAKSGGRDSRPIGDVVQVGFQFSRRN
jgi:tetratricopeptide (TPR) repeat protein